MVHQHFTLAENLSALENIILGTENLFAMRLGRGKARAKLRALMGHSGLNVDLDARISTLSVGEKQRVEILKALYRDARVLVLDEPTAVLTPQESQTLFVTLKSLAADGLAIIFISHKLAEVIAASDRVAVLRAGCKVADLPTSECDQRQLAELMVGKSVPVSSREHQKPGAVLLALSGISSGEGREALRGVELILREGEILGIAGVSGNGQGALARVISGLETPRGGTLIFAGQTMNGADARDMIAAGIARIPEDRHKDGIIGAMTVAENLVIEEVRRPVYQRFGFLRFGEIARRAREAISAYDIRCQGEGCIGPIAVGR